MATSSASLSLFGFLSIRGIFAATLGARKKVAVFRRFVALSRFSATLGGGEFDAVGHFYFSEIFLF